MEEKVFKIIRKIRLWDEWNKIILSAFWICCWLGLHQGIHATCHNEAERYKSYQQHPLPQFDINSQDCLDRYVDTARNFSWREYQLRLEIGDSCRAYGQPPARLRFKTISVKDLDHICIQPNSVNGTAIYFPEGHDVENWIHVDSSPFIIIYPPSERINDIRERSTTAYELSRTDPTAENLNAYMHTMTASRKSIAELGFAIHLGTGKNFSPAYEQQIEKLSTPYEVHSILESRWVSGFSISILLLVFWLTVSRRQFTGYLSKIVSEYEQTDQNVLLDLLENEFAHLYINRGWSNHLKNDVRSYCKKFIRQEQTELNRQRKERRHEALQQLADRKKATELEKKLDRIRKKVEQDKKKQRPISIGKTMQRVREEFRSEPSAIGRLAQSDILEILTERDIARDPQQDKLVQKVLASSHNLSGLEDMPIEDLERLSKILRRMKRKVSRMAFTIFVDQFEGATPASYLETLQDAENGDYSLLNKKLLDRPVREYVSGEHTIVEIPLLLKDKRVLLIGGDPSLKNHYVEGLLQLGAHSIEYFASDQIAPLAKARGDVGLIFWKTVAHKQQDQLKKKQIPLVYLEHYTKSLFLYQAIPEIQTQLNLV
jgi:hypothetical protein